MSFTEKIYCVYEDVTPTDVDKVKYGDRQESFTNKYFLQRYLADMIQAGETNLLVLTEDADDEVYAEVEKYQPHYKKEE